MTGTALLARLKVQLRMFRTSSLCMNALYLMLSTFVIAALGFLFWVLIARTYDTSAVGLATTLLSASSLLSLLSLAGFDSTFIRFLPGSNRKNEYINSGFIVVALIGFGLGVGFAIVLPFTSPSLSVLHGPGAFISFILFTVATSLNVLTNAVFLAFKQARNILIINTLFSLFKAILPLIIPHGDAITIFALAGSAQLVGLVLSIAWMRRSCGYTFSLHFDREALRRVRGFSFSVYIAHILNLLPPTLLPLIVLRQLGASSAAYFYMAFTIANVLYAISFAAMQSAFAEGSYDETALKAHIAKATKLVGVLLLPAILITVGLSGFILHIFGAQYAAKGSALLQVFAVSALAVTVCAAMGAIFKVTQNLWGVVVTNAVYAVVIVGLSYLLTPRMGIMAIGWAWVLGNVASGGIGLFFLKQGKRNTGGAYGKAPSAWW